jgi:glucose-1-phosphate thymidylyltransferase
MDIVYPWDLIHVNDLMIHDKSASISGIIEKGVTVKGDVSVGENTKIYSGCYIVGPVVIGDGCEIGPNSCIFPSTTIGNNSVVHPFSEVRNSILMNNVHIGSNSFISHSVIAQGSRIQHYFSNLLGEATMEIENEYKKIDKIGTMIGENCNIESNVIVDPGIIIGRKCNIGSMNRISKNIPSESKVM